MRKQEIFWIHIEKQLSKLKMGGGLLPSRWASEAKKEFSDILGEMVKERCKYDPKLKQKYLPNRLIKSNIENFEIYPTTFDGIFLESDFTKKRKNYTCNQYALFFECEDWYAYLKKHKIIKEVLLERDERDVEEITKEHFVGKISSHYLENKDFNEIPILGYSSINEKSIPMASYYINIGYLPTSTLSNREMLYKLEKDSHKNNEKLMQHYINDRQLAATIFNDYDKLIILGNPGMGKTTFAKWICYQWALDRTFMERIPIYISTRNLRFEEEKNSIINHIKSFYSGKENVIRYDDIRDLIKENGNYHLVLDGFDEMTKKQQSQMLGDLRELEHRNSYVLLSRPYAVIGKNINSNGCVEIVGFNNTSILSYVENVFELDGKLDEVEKFILYLDNNPLLREFSRIPLMLSYIVTIYLLEEQVTEKLDTVDSFYKLQNLTIKCIRQYYTKKDLHSSPEVFFESTITKAIGLASWMERTRHYAIFSDDLNIIRFGGVTLLENLSVIGIGRLEKASLLDRRFQFITVTLQEYLAANAVVEELQIDVFIELISEDYNWNLCRMVIGKCANEYNDKFLNEVWERLIDKRKDSSVNIYNDYVLLLILAEVPNRLVEKWVSFDLLCDFLKIYINTSTNKPNWRGILLDVFVRIIYKLSPPKKQKFAKHFLKELEEIVLQFVDTPSRFELEFYIKNYSIFGVFSRLTDDDFSSQRIMDWIYLIDGKEEEIQTVRKGLDFEKDSEEIRQISEEEVALYNSSLYLLDMLEICSRETLIPLVNSFTTKGNLTYTMYERFQNILLQFETVESLLSQIEEKIGNTYNPLNEIEIIYLIERIGNTLTNQKLSTTTHNHCFQMLSKMTSFFRERNDKDENLDIADFLHKISYAYAQLGTKESISNLFEIITNEENIDVLPEVNVPKKLILEAIEDKFQYFFNPLTEFGSFDEPSWIDLNNTLLVICNISSHTGYLFSKHRERIIDILEILVKEYPELLEAEIQIQKDDTLMGSSNWEEEMSSNDLEESIEGKIELDKIDLIRDFLNYLDRIFVSGYFIDKRFVINKFTQSELLKDNNYIKYGFLLELLKNHNVSFSESHIWDFIYHLIDFEYEPFSIIKIISNNDIFLIDENLEKLLPIWKYLSSLFKKYPESISETPRLFIIFFPIFNTLKTIKKLGNYSRNTTHQKLLREMSDILDMEGFRKNVISEWSVLDSASYGFAAYIMLTYFDDTKFNVLINDCFDDVNFDIITSMSILSHVFNNKEISFLENHLSMESYEKIINYFSYYAKDN